MERILERKIEQKFEACGRKGSFQLCASECRLKGEKHNEVSQETIIYDIRKVYTWKAQQANRHLQKV
jgi:hypothetical protein